MARKSTVLTLAGENRDKGKMFVLTELDALKAWNWGGRAITAMIRNGAQIPEEVRQGGIVTTIALGVFHFGHLPWGELEPLRNELLACVQIVPTPSRPDIVRPLVDTDIEEPDTYSRLIKEVFALHTGFFPDAAPSKSPSEDGAGAAAPS